MERNYAVKYQLALAQLELGARLSILSLVHSIFHHMCCQVCQCPTITLTQEQEIQVFLALIWCQGSSILMKSCC